LAGNLRYAVRLLARAPGFTAVAILTLALGIGANTALFTVADAVLLQPLPYQHPERLVLISGARAASPGAILPFSYPRFTFLREKSRAFSALAAFGRDVCNLTGAGQPEELAEARVSWNFFSVLGIRPALGRAFLPEEGGRGARPVCLISHGLWTRRFGARPQQIGQSITLDSTPYTVVGVLPRDFEFPLLTGADVWTPRAFELSLITQEQVRAGAGYLDAIARLNSGLSATQAQAEMEVLNRQYQRENPRLADADPALSIRAADLQEQTVANVRPALEMLSGAVGLLLLIACANMAALLLSRALGRTKEIAVRAALGAPRRSLMGQLLLESVLLAVAGGALGILLSAAGTPALLALGQENLPRLAAIRINTQVLAFTAGLSLATGLVFGWLPALQLSRPDLNVVLRGEARGSTGSRWRGRFRSLLVVAQVALSLVLLVGAGLLIRSFVRLRSVPPGFDPRHVLSMRISLPPARYSHGPQMSNFFDQVVKRVETLPGVQAAAVASALPVNPVRFSPVLAEGQPDVPLAQRPLLAIQMISPAYFRTLGVRLLQGRAFTDADNAGAPLVAVVNETLVRRFWPNQNPLGKHLYLGRMDKPTQAVTVVGVAADVRNISLAAAPDAEVCIPFAQRPWTTMYLLVRTEGDPHNWTPATRAAVTSVDPDQPVTAAATLEEVLSDSTAPERFSMFLLGVFSLTAMLLAAVGLYGAIAYSVAERTREIGVRMALGAQRAAVFRMVIGHGIRLALIGLAIGIPAALEFGWLMSGLLFQLSPRDPLSLIAAALLFLAIAVLASYVPALRATRVDPADALRSQ
jgi:putative ABC transport system permease protein